MDDALAARRFRTAMDLFEAGVEMMRQNLRRQFPEADEKEIAARLAQWLQERPGAEFGDCDGRPVPWPRPSSPPSSQQQTPLEEKLAGYEYRPALRPYRPTPAEKGSGVSDVSVNHDHYLAEEDPEPQK